MFEMNATKSLIVWLVAVVYTVGCFLAFAHGAEQVELGPKLGWMLGALAGFALEVFVSYKWKWLKK